MSKRVVSNTTMLTNNCRFRHLLNSIDDDDVVGPGGIVLELEVINTDGGNTGILSSAFTNRDG